MAQFYPSSWALDHMIANAEAKFEADRERARLRREAQADRRMERMIAAQAEARRRRALWGEQ